ncbi:MAG: leucine-rich repeat domain-containing protein [Lachnospiraceae bacterium]|nr:leucine-rich repeat domain-containing protein [Lachnospiraceae bacterium]
MNQDFHIEQGVLTAYTGRDECVTVPDWVHTIGEGAFKACVSLKRVVLPDHLHHIQASAFKGCRKLRDIQIPAEVSTIGDYAFHRCHSLESVTLPSSVRELGACAFLYCDSLTHVSIPGVVRIGTQAFVNDVLLQSLEISPDLQEDLICDVFTGCGGISRISFSDGRQFPFPNAVEAVAGQMELPSLVRAIAADILRMMELNGRCLVKFLTNLKHVNIPEGIQAIGKSCFFDKRGILSVTLPASLKEIQSRAFRNCIGLETVRFLGEPSLIHEDAFKNCTSLKEICTADGAVHRIEGIVRLTGETMPPLVQTIHRQVLGNFRLSGTILLKYLGDESRVLVPQGVTRIAEEAFAENEAIDRVILPDTLEEIGAGAFRGCLVLQSIHCYGTPDAKALSPANEAGSPGAVPASTGGQLPDHISRIGPGAFEHCVKLLRIRLPQSLTCLEERIFKHCHKLKEVFLGSHLQSIGEQAFYGCGSLKEIRFPDSLTVVGEMAFYRCSGLREVTLPPGLDQAGSLAFAQSGVRRVRLQGSGLRYGTGLFFRCLFLDTLTAEEGVRHIPDQLAYGCTALKQVSLPDTLESVGRNVWEYTPFLEAWIQEHGILKVSDFQTPLSPAKTDSIFWDGRSLAGEVTLPEETRIIAGGAFYGNTALTAVHIPDQATWIGPAAFKGCSSLRHVTWPSCVTTAEAGIFSGCTSLETVACAVNPGPEPSYSVPWRFIRERAFYNCQCLRHLSLSLTRIIGKEAFSGCTAFTPGDTSSLVEAGEGAFDKTQASGSLPVMGTILVSGQDFSGTVHLPEGITAIAPFAFSGNRQVTEIFLPDSLLQIGEGAFWGCTGLTYLHFSSAPCTIGARTFEKCTGLVKIRLHADRIGDAAFACCQSLKQVELVGPVVLESRLFEHCTSLERCICPQAAVIRDYAFSGCCRLEDFDFQSIEEIASYGFQNCDCLRQITLQNHTRIRPHAFEDCGRLEQICLTGDRACLQLYEYAFSGCTALCRVVCQGQTWTLNTYRDILSEDIPEPVRQLFHSAFSCFAIDKEAILLGYRGLGRILHIPEGIRRIEAEVFRDVLMLEEVTIPKTVEYIGARAFHGTAWLEKRRRQSPMVTVRHMLLDGSCCVGEVTVPGDIRLVCGWAFAGGMGIRRIHFLSDRVRVEPYAFRNCIYLKEMILSDGSSFSFHGISDRHKELPPLVHQAVMDSLNCFKTNEDHVLVECTGNISRLLLADGITAIADRVFQDGNLLTEITLTPTVISIGQSAFARCKWLRIVRQAGSVTSIGDLAFAGCQTLEAVELSESFLHMGIRAFENCTSLREILLPEGLEEIPDRAFFRCHSLRRVSLPSTLKRIGKEAFAFCRHLAMPSVPEGTIIEERAFTEISDEEERSCTTAD